MRKLTKNQTVVLESLTEEFKPLSEICDSYGVWAKEQGYSPVGHHHSNCVSNCLNSLIKRGLVKYEYRGLYAKINQENEKEDK